MYYRHHTSLAPVYAYAPIGKRAFFKAPRNHGKNTTLLCSLRVQGIGPSMAVEGATTREDFEAYLEHFLAPILKAGRVVIMDNHGAHRPKRAKELIEGRDCEHWNARVPGGREGSPLTVHTAPRRISYEIRCQCSPIASSS
jgi:hypothetical protein